ncbi:hypothetical protein [Actinomadura madurae]|uniref:hypothetical protein n=1 Tax=Actinomadura madurae TaxID=1993 RepID=UPI0020D212FC|nr:hypothetical protein [Actinomadura madurae]MCQ0017770.1 hypothetical protein [Actinomadura madurae]
MNFTGNCIDSSAGVPVSEHKPMYVSIADLPAQLRTRGVDPPLILPVQRVRTVLAARQVLRVDDESAHHLQDMTTVPSREGNGRVARGGENG